MGKITIIIESNMSTSDLERRWQTLICKLEESGSWDYDDGDIYIVPSDDE